MLFGFFGGGDSTSADVPVNPFLTNTNTTTAISTTIASTTDTITDTITAAVASVAEPKVRVNTLLEDTTVSSNVVKGKAVEVVFSAALLVALAKKFSREK